MQYKWPMEKPNKKPLRMFCLQTKQENTRQRSKKSLSTHDDHAEDNSTVDNEHQADTCMVMSF